MKIGKGLSKKELRKRLKNSYKAALTLSEELENTDEEILRLKNRNQTLINMVDGRDAYRNSFWRPWKHHVSIAFDIAPWSWIIKPRLWRSTGNVSFQFLFLRLEWLVD
jgi:hypothetical protein